MNMLLEVKDIKVHYGKVEAVSQVSLQVAEGEIVALLGSNGAGKSTTLKTISGLKRPTFGEIWCSGARIDNGEPDDIVRKGIGHVPEGRRVFPLMTVEDNLLMGAYSRKDREGVKKDLENIYKSFPRLGERKKQRAGSMSGGEQQILAISRALMCKPKLLMLDEPSIGLSPIMVDQISVVIKDIHQQGISVLLVEQNATMALRLADRGYVIETGHIVLQGTGKELLNDAGVKKAYLGG